MRTVILYEKRFYFITYNSIVRCFRWLSIQSSVLKRLIVTCNDKGMKLGTMQHRQQGLSQFYKHTTSRCRAQSTAWLICTIMKPHLVSTSSASVFLDSSRASALFFSLYSVLDWAQSRSVSFPQGLKLLENLFLFFVTGEELVFFFV